MLLVISFAVVCGAAFELRPGDLQPAGGQPDWSASPCAASSPSTAGGTSPGAINGMLPLLVQSKDPLPATWSAAYNMFTIDLENFAGEVEPKEYLVGQKLYRVIGSTGNPTGAYWAESEPPASEATWRSEYAVPVAWNAATCEEEYTVGAAGLRAWVGTVAPQKDSGYAFLQGMGAQVYVPLSNSQIDLQRIRYRPTPWSR